MLIELQDGGIVEIWSDTDSSSGCETCDYGSSYVNEFRFDMTQGIIYIEVDTMYEWALSEGFMMTTMLQNVDIIKGMTEDEFFEWIKVKTEEVASTAYDSEVSVRFDKHSQSDSKRGDSNVLR